jgi:hypothetical protein
LQFPAGSLIINGMITHKYINDFLYFVVRPDPGGKKDKLIYCSGVNITRFFPMTRRRFGIGGNPVTSGLQLVNYDICGLAMSKGATPKVILGHDCAGIAPTKETWHVELVHIENAADLLPDDIISLGVRGLVQKIVACSWLEYQAPDKLLAPEELQVYLEDLCKAMM